MQKSAAKAVRERWRRAAASIISQSRRDKDFTQSQLAAAVGWSRDTLAKVETGKGKIEFGDIMLIAKALDEKPELLIRRILGWN